MRVLTSALSAAVIAAAVLSFCDIKFTVKTKRLYSYLSTVGIGAVCILSGMFFGGVFNSVILLWGIILFSVIICKAEFVSALFSGLMLSVILVFSSLLSAFMLNAVFSMSINELEDSAFLSVSGTTISLTLFITASYIILRFTDKEGGAVFSLLLMPLSSLLTAITIAKLCLSNKLNTEISLLLCALNLLLLFSNIIVFYVHDSALRSRRYADKIKNEYELWKNRDEYYHELDEQNKSSRVLMHDINRHLNTIGSISEGEARGYISELSDSYCVSNPIDYSSNATLNLITHRFYEKCKCANIRFDVNIREARLDFMTAPDITALFDNLLENAYESASASDQRSIDFSAYIRNKNFLIIRLTNSCGVKPEYENGELKTTKSSPFHGIGTRSIKRIVKKYDGDIDMIFNEQEGTFESVIMLRTSKEV